MARPQNLRARIAAALPVTVLPGPLPLRYHAAAPHSRLSDLSKTPPYWAYPWPGGCALIAHLVAHPDLVKGKCVLDIGAGSGLVGIAAALLGAASVTASEIDPAAREAIALNAALNEVCITLSRDLLSGPPPEADLILIGDLFYAPDLATRVLAFLTQTGTAEALVGDIGRADLPRARFRVLASYPVRDVGDPPSAASQCGEILQFIG